MPSDDTILSINDVTDLLDDQNAIITGGKTREGYPIITLPDQSNFSSMSDSDYQKLMTYLTSVPSMHEADLGFALVIDRRSDKWSSVKSTLLKISSFFPGLIHIAFVVRPSGFFQKAISELVICGCLEELHQFIDQSELTIDMDGSMPYSHKQWIKQRIGLEEFSRQTQSVSGSLDKFTWRLREGICEAEAYESEIVRAMLNSETNDYLALKEQILNAARTGEQLLSDIRHRLEPSAVVNITAVERLLVQLEETERTFDEFWDEHSARLRQCLDVQRFYIDYKKVQFNLEQHLKVVSQMTEIGETVIRVEYLILEFNTLEKICIEDMEQSEEIVNFGRNMISGRHYWPLECVGVRCDELDRTCCTLRDRLEQRSEILQKSLQLQITVDKSNKWCARGIELLETRQIENCACALDAAEVSLSKLMDFMEGSNKFNGALSEFSTPETKALVSQVLQRIEDVKTMCNKRIITLKRLVEKPPRPVQTVTPEPAIPFQPVIRPATVTITPKSCLEVIAVMSCSKCNLSVSENNVLCCSSCSKIFHRSCVKLSELELKFVIKLKKAWTCPDCTGEVPILKHSVSDIEVIREDVFKITTKPRENRLEILEDQIKQLKDENTVLVQRLSNIELLYLKHWKGSLKFIEIEKELAEIKEKLTNFIKSNENPSNLISTIEKTEQFISDLRKNEENNKIVHEPICNKVEINHELYHISEDFLSLSIEQENEKLKKQINYVEKNLNLPVTNFGLGQSGGNFSEVVLDIENKFLKARLDKLKNGSCGSEPENLQEKANGIELGSKGRARESVYSVSGGMDAIMPTTIHTLLVHTIKFENKICKLKDSNVEKEQEVIRGHVLSELLETERTYVSELSSVIKGYKIPLLSEEASQIVPHLEGKVDVMFGNFEEIYNFHNDIFLQDLENCISTTELVALCFTHRRDALHKLYSTYCQNYARSEKLRECIGDHAFLKACQSRLGHKLPLAAYLLKPIQRITKYQLLLKDLLNNSDGKKWCCELQEALECMLVVLKCVNDSMHQVAITGFKGDLAALGDLLMQGSFSVWTDSKKDMKLRLKPMQRHLFLYQKAILFCKKAAIHEKATYDFKSLIKMSDVGLTESVKLDGKTFEIWLPGRSEVHTLQAKTAGEKKSWVDQIKNLLLLQLTEMKMKANNKGARSVSLDHYMKSSTRALSYDESKPKPAPSDEDAASSSEFDSEDDETFSNQVSQDSNIITYSQGSRYRVLADYVALGHSELPMKENDLVTLLKVGCAGWWYVRLYGASEGLKKEGWVPEAYLEICGRKSSRSCQSVTSDTSSH